LENYHEDFVNFLGHSLASIKQVGFR